jgi:Spy/CpxP family protein refolding chaperone
MRALSLNFALRPVRIATATFVLVLAAGITQTAIAQPHGGYGGHAGHHGSMGLMHPQKMERVLDSVNATAEQRAQIRQIVLAAHADLKAQREAGRSLRQQSLVLFAQPTVDARAAETLRQQMLVQHDQASKRALQAMLDVSRVLTPEQRKTLADRMAQRKAMMERHRAEREAATTK